LAGIQMERLDGTDELGVLPVPDHGRHGTFQSQ
jgi:hypothetical protein